MPILECKNNVFILPPGEYLVGDPIKYLDNFAKYISSYDYNGPIVMLSQELSEIIAFPVSVCDDNDIVSRTYYDQYNNDYPVEIYSDLIGITPWHHDIDIPLGCHLFEFFYKPISVFAHYSRMGNNILNFENIRIDLSEW